MIKTKGDDYIWFSHQLNEKQKPLEIMEYIEQLISNPIIMAQSYIGNFEYCLVFSINKKYTAIELNNISEKVSLALTDNKWFVRLYKTEDHVFGTIFSFIISPELVKEHKEPSNDPKFDFEEN